MDAFPVAFASSSAGTGLAALNARSFFSLYDCGYSNRQMQRVAVRAVLMGCPEESSMPTSARGSSAVRKSLPGGADAPTTAREKSLQPYGALDCFGWRSEGGAGGNEGKRVSSGYNRRRRLAPRSSGKQQAKRTSVRAAPIVCPEESPLLAATHDNSVIRETITGGMTRRLRRELGLVILWASRRLSVPEGFQRGTKGSGYPVDTTAEGG